MPSSKDKCEYKVMTLQDIEVLMYSILSEDGAVEAVPGEPDKLKITNIELAKSENIMPRVFNQIGSEGWKLVTINPSQLYVFSRSPEAKATFEYKVLTLKDIDTLIFTRLVSEKAAEIIPKEPGKFKILDVEKAKSQNVMPQVLDAFGKEGWSLSAVNKAQLYIFSRLSVANDEAKKETKPKAEKKVAAKKAPVKKAPAKKATPKKAATKKSKSKAK